MTTLERTKLTLKGVAELAGLEGKHLGYSRWLIIDQHMIDMFSDATGDHQWIHSDPKRAKAEGPFGGTIAQGYLTLSLFPILLWEILEVEGATVLNYGIDKLRFTGVVPEGSRVRLGVTVTKVATTPKGATVSFAAVVEVEGIERPALVAEILLRY